MLSIVLAANSGTLLIFLLLGGMCIDIFGVLWETAMRREVPPAALSRVSSYDALGSLMFGPLGLIVAGPLANWVGTSNALLYCAASIVVPTALALLAPGVHRMTLSPEPADADGATDADLVATGPAAPDRHPDLAAAARAAAARASVPA
jgi:hypothetical protein